MTSILLAGNRLLSWDAGAAAGGRVRVEREPSGAARRCLEGFELEAATAAGWREDDWQDRRSCLQVLEPGANGLLADPAGGVLLFADHGNRRVASLPLGAVRGFFAAETVVGRYLGARLNSPNDLAVNPATGDLYFTDPPFGLRLGSATCAETDCPPAGCDCGLPFAASPTDWWEQVQSATRIRDTSSCRHHWCLIAPWATRRDTSPGLGSTGCRPPPAASRRSRPVRPRSRS